MVADAGPNAGDTAWLLTATALVLFMTLPGLAAFYSGLVRRKNVLSISMQCFAIACLVSVLWLICGYSLSFGRGGSWQALIGPLANFGLAGISRASLHGHISAGTAALVAALVLKPRRGFPHTAMAPHNMPLTVLGGSSRGAGSGRGRRRGLVRRGDVRDPQSHRCDTGSARHRGQRARGSRSHAARGERVQRVAVGAARDMRYALLPDLIQSIPRGRAAVQRLHGSRRSCRSALSPLHLRTVCVEREARSSRDRQPPGRPVALRPRGRTSPLKRHRRGTRCAATTG